MVTVRCDTWSQVRLAPKPTFPLLTSSVLSSPCWFSNLHCLCTLAVSPCPEHLLLRNLLGQVFCLCLDLNMLLRMKFGVSPAAPRTRVRESLTSCPGPRDRLAGPAFCPAHPSRNRVGHILYSCLMEKCAEPWLFLSP